MLSASQQYQLFLAIQVIGGHIGLPLLIVTFLLMKNSRSIVVIHFCASWVIFSVSFSLILYRTTPLEAASSQGLCLLSQAMTNGAAVMTSLSTLTLILNIWFSILRPSWYEKKEIRYNVECLLAYSPYIAFLAPFFVTYALSAPSDGQQGDNTFSSDYCLNSGDMWIAVDAISIAILGIATFLDAIVLWSVFRRAQAEPPSEIKYLHRMIIKLSLFSIYRIVTSTLTMAVLIDGLKGNTMSLSFVNFEVVLSALQTGGSFHSFNESMLHNVDMHYSSACSISDVVYKIGRPQDLEILAFDTSSSFLVVQPRRY
ncbi:hypothetical protein SISSUDRAFT_1067410 [Sistotremastrum suecicum HHB10207 ss-3]|uniref:G-protein coupled receptors family 2 profile 2 domain-containing protein n=1 Tax=Sistotremastrum suecicum HHB10207 ss-3 TaxID=1314776 RepID=A0A165X5J8_9AGAM|nr:hypothetical protein SISSUDRAFT_1067410 [Sistotremastrum suecicum HHB10207 ss-3]